MRKICNYHKKRESRGRYGKYGAGKSERDDDGSGSSKLGSWVNVLTIVCKVHVNVQNLTPYSTLITKLHLMLLLPLPRLMPNLSLLLKYTKISVLYEPIIN